MIDFLTSFWSAGIVSVKTAFCKLTNLLFSSVFAVIFQLMTFGFDSLSSDSAVFLTPRSGFGILASSFSSPPRYLILAMFLTSCASSAGDRLVVYVKVYFVFSSLSFLTVNEPFTGSLISKSAVTSFPDSSTILIKFLSIVTVFGVFSSFNTKS